MSGIRCKISRKIKELTFNRVSSKHLPYLTEQGCPELNILFCENDVHSYGNLPGLKFTRTRTIGAGDDLCDFKMELM
ncbi:MAG: L-2-amino-thiazoline-4-carboxylic acid hydrolase [Lachnospiraceae bacterium]|nr:L-2-amino-thiazoline-4-carboxylic acid hydrolase [Lachnospiraceae bacterium]